jgi:hypothetical protein
MSRRTGFGPGRSLQLGAYDLDTSRRSAGLLRCEDYGPGTTVLVSWLQDNPGIGIHEILGRDPAFIKAVHLAVSQYSEAESVD